MATLYDNMTDLFHIPRRIPSELVEERDRQEKLKRLTDLKDLSKADFFEMIYDFVYVYRSCSPVAKKWGLEPRRCRHLIHTFCSDLLNLKESYDLAMELPGIVEPSYDLKLNNNDRKISDISRMTIKHINEEFLAKLSKEDEALSEAEQIYCWIFIHTGNNREALEKSGLDVGLIPNLEEFATPNGPRTKRHRKFEVNLRNGLALRGYYLRSKSNIKDYLHSLRERKLEDINVDKGYIQSQLITLIEQMKEEGDTKQRGNLLRAIEMLGKTVPGTFSETINVTDVRPDEALDRLLALTKANIAKKIDVLDSRQYSNELLIEHTDD